MLVLPPSDESNLFICSCFLPGFSREFPNSSVGFGSGYIGLIETQTAGALKCMVFPLGCAGEEEGAHGSLVICFTFLNLFIFPKLK